MGTNAGMKLPLGATGITPEGETLRVREVWDYNLEDEFEIIRNIVDQYPYVAMDTEFPGVVVRSVGNFQRAGQFQYATLRRNVNMLKLIQLGLTFTDEDGNLPRHNGELCVWQFNFKEFRLGEDMYAQESIDLLKQSGIDFNVMQRGGVDVQRFGELLTSSGVVLNEAMRWVTFHSGYDFGYMIKVLTCDELPDREEEFFELMQIYFPCIYDIKYLMKFCDSLHGGLSRLAELLNVERIGPQHQAGSDSLLTGFVFHKLLKTHFNGIQELGDHAGILFGLGTDGAADLLE